MLKSSKMYSINRLTIDKDLKKNIFLPNIEVRKALSNFLRVHAKEKTSFNLNLKIIEKDIVISLFLLKNRRDVLVNGFQYYHTTTEK